MIRIGDINTGDTITAQFDTESAGTFTITGPVRKQPRETRGQGGFTLWVGGRSLEGGNGFVKIVEHTPALPPEPALYTVHADADGDVWIRLLDGWRLIGEIAKGGDIFDWARANAIFGPFTPLTRVI